VTSLLNTNDEVQGITIIPSTSSPEVTSEAVPVLLSVLDV